MYLYGLTYINEILGFWWTSLISELDGSWTSVNDQFITIINLYFN